jgi:hypothetical protein
MTTQATPTRAEFTAALREQDAADDAWRDFLRRTNPLGYEPEAVAISRRCHDARVALLALIDRLP